MIKIKMQTNMQKRMTEKKAMIISGVVAVSVFLFVLILFIILNQTIGTPISLGICLAIMFGLIAAIIGVFAFPHKIKTDMARINKCVYEKLDEIGFNITKCFQFSEFKCNDTEKYNKFIAVDYANKKIGLIDYRNDTIIIVGFDEILNYEVYDASGMVTSGRSIDGYLLGKRTAVSTSSFTSRTQKSCNILRLNIRIKSLENPQIAYDIISETAFNLGYSELSNKYNMLMLSLQEVISFLEIVIKETD